MRTWRLLLTVTAGMMTAGCDSNQRMLGPGNLDVINLQLRYDYLGEKTSLKIPKLVEYEKLRCKYDKDAGEANTSAAQLKADLDVLQVARNNIVNGLMAIDDFNFQEYASKTGLFQRSSATAADITVLGLTSAAAVVGGQQTKTVLAGVAALVTGSRIAVDKEVFYQNTLPVLLDRMQFMRIKRRADIQSKLQSKSVLDYSLTAAMSDVLDYFHDGTLYAAIADIAKETAGQAAAVGGATAAQLLDGLVAVINKHNPKVTLDGVVYTVANAAWDTDHSVLTVNATRDDKKDITIPLDQLGAGIKNFLAAYTDPDSGAPALASGGRNQFANASVKVRPPASAATEPATKAPATTGPATTGPAATEPGATPGATTTK